MAHECEDCSSVSGPRGLPHSPNCCLVRTLTKVVHATMCQHVIVCPRSKEGDISVSKWLFITDWTFRFRGEYSVLIVRFLVGLYMILSLVLELWKHGGIRVHYSMEGVQTGSTWEKGSSVWCWTPVWALYLSTHTPPSQLSTTMYTDLSVSVLLPLNVL